MSQTVTGVYAILDRDDLGLAESLVAATGAGARLLQVRVKAKPGGAADGLSDRALLELCVRVKAVCHRHGAKLIVNDRLDLALLAEADGVHLGQDDLPAAVARNVVQRVLGARPFLIGVSTHTLGQVQQACADGADYLGYGPVFATSTKANPDPVVGVDGLAAAVRGAGSTPVVAIGGITLARLADVRATGAAAACLVSALNDAADPAAAGRTAQAIWHR